MTARGLPDCRCGCEAFAHRGPIGSLSYCYYGRVECTCERYAPAPSVLLRVWRWLVGWP